MPAWSPDGRSIVYVTWTTTGGHIKRVAATGGAPETLTRTKATTSIPPSRPTASRIVFLAGAASDQLYSILLDTPPEDERERRRATARSAASTRPTRSRSAGCRRPAAPSTLVASAQGGRGPHFARNDSSRVYLTTNRGLQSITMDGYDRRTLLRITGAGPGNNPPGATRFACRPTARARSSACRSKHYLVTVPRAGRETVEVRIQGRAENTSVPVKRMSLEGGDYLDWTADGKAVTWAWGAQFFRQPTRRERAAEDRRRRRDAARAAERLGAAHRRAHHHDEGRRGDSATATSSSPTTASRPSAASGSLQAPAGTPHHRRRRQDHHAGPRRRALAHVGAARPAPDRGLAVPRQPRVRRDDDARSADVDAGRVRLCRHGRRRRDARAAHLRHRARRLLRIRASRIATPRSASSSATRRRTAPTRSSSTSPAIASSGSGSSRRARSTASRPPSRARST